MTEYIEIWKPIVGFEGSYSISNFGRVRSERNWRNSVAGMILRPDIINTGYARIKLYDSNGKRVRFFAHKLVALHFIGPCPEGMEIHHKDSVRCNNVAWNLEYVTHSQNISYFYKDGGEAVKGEANGISKLKNDDVINIRKEYKTGIYSQRYLARKYGVYQQTICKITTNRAWKHLLNTSA
jgi:hypothetical protein